MIELIRRLYRFVFGKSVGAETLRYLIVGGITSIIGFGSFALLLLISPLEYAASASIFGLELAITEIDIYNAISIVVAVLFAYVANKLVVFKRRCDTKKELALEFLRFIGARAFSMLLDFGIVWLFYSILGYDALIGKVASAVFVVIANYVFSKLFVFKKNDGT